MTRKRQPGGRTVAALVAAVFIAVQTPPPAMAENQMGYRLMSTQEAAALSRGGGALGLDFVAGTRITDAGMTFELLKVSGVHRGSAGQRAGFRPGDQLIALDGLVFADLQAFAGYVRSRQPGQHISIDYIPGGGGPGQAQRVDVVAAGAGTAAQTAAPSGGLSTGTKVAIGVGAVALFGCYELGCFNHRPGPAPAAPPPH